MAYEDGRRTAYAFLIEHRTVLCAAFFFTLDCGAIILSHFEKRSWVFTMVIFVLSLFVLVISVYTRLSGRRDVNNARIEADARVITMLELIASAAQFVIALYNFVRVLLNSSKDFYKIDWILAFALAAFILYEVCKKRKENARAEYDRHYVNPEDHIQVLVNDHQEIPPQEIVPDNSTDMNPQEITLSRRNIKSLAIKKVLTDGKDRVVAEILNQRDAIYSKIQRDNLTGPEMNEASTLEKIREEFNIDPQVELQEWKNGVFPLFEFVSQESVDPYDVLFESTTYLQDVTSPLIMIMRFPPLHTKKWGLLMKKHCDQCKEGVRNLLLEPGEGGSIVTKFGQQDTLIVTGEADISQLWEKLVAYEHPSANPSSPDDEGGEVEEKSL